MENLLYLEEWGVASGCNCIANHRKIRHFPDLKDLKLSITLRNVPEALPRSVEFPLRTKKHPICGCEGSGSATAGPGPGLGQVLMKGPGG